MIDWFEPGYKAGGPIRSVANLIAYLKQDYCIYVLTGDRDLGDSQSYTGVEIGKWLGKDGFEVYYLPPARQKWSDILEIIRQVGPDKIYLNSMYSLRFSFYPVLMKYFGLLSSDLILAPRGMLRSSAIRKKTFKKMIFLSFLRQLGLSRFVTFQATDDVECQDIYKRFGTSSRVETLTNFPVFQKEFTAPPAREEGELKVIFVGRVHPIKNLHLLLDAVQLSKARIKLTIIAPIEDKRYWEKCLKRMETMRGDAVVEHFNSMSHSAIEEKILNNHIFALPTNGENFGHAIFEAMASGRPVLISDQTPWRGLEKVSAGWDISSFDAVDYAKVLDLVSEMNQEAFLKFCKGAWNFCQSSIDIVDLKKGYSKLFN